MSGRKQRTNKPLAAVSILLCVSCGLILTRSSAGTSSSGEALPDMIVADDTDKEQPMIDLPDSESTDVSESADSEETVPTDTPVPEDDTDSSEKISAEASPEADSGIWTPVGSNWYFMVNGTGVTGWLTDTDGRRYFFDANGVMQTGWLEEDGNRYYLNADGVMQTGTVTIDGEDYSFGEDGILKEESSSEGQKSFVYYTSQNTTEDPRPADRSSDSSKKTSDDTKKAKKAKVTAVPTEKPDAGMIALTFDDGPSDFTPRLLDCLEKNNAKATFFTVGTQIEYLPDLLSRMESLGCEVGSHTYDHADLATLSVEDIQSEISRNDDLIQAQLGHPAALLRPPYGNLNDTVSSSSGKPMILWSVDTEDALDPDNADAAKIADLALSQAQDGAVILMHDIFSTSVDAAELIIPQLIQEGYELVTVSELAQARGITLEAGNTYGSMPIQ